jgi:acyl-CoA synthetase (AMP-forming)/AMP-acid ligase II
METELAEVRTIPHLVSYVAKRFSGNTAIIDGDSVLTYAALEVQARNVARACLANGIERGDRVAIWAPNSARWILAALGAQIAGASLVPLNTRMKGGEAAPILQKSGARLLLTVNDFLGIDYPELLQGQPLPQLEKTVLLSDRGSDRGWESFLESGRSIADSRVEQRLSQVSGDELSDIVFTSGTTGLPKGVMTSHEQNLRVFRYYSGVLGLREGDRSLIANPFFNTFGYKAGWLSALMRGATVLPHAVFDASAILERIQRERVTVLPGPPTLYQTLLAHPRLADFDLSSLRFAITGSSSVPLELVERMRAELGFETVLTAYGLTESCGLVSICSAADDARTIATTSGRVIDGVRIRVVDDAGGDVTSGTPGEILVSGYNVMKGYFRDEEETARAIDADGWLHTGDVGVLDERGYVRITGRKKDMFIVGGFNCYPAEIENILLGHPSIAQAAVVGVADDRLGEVASAHVVLKAGVALMPAELLGWCRNNMANYKVPRFVEILDELPMNAAGKVMKSLLR